jgi:hypothetical protein
MAEVIWNEARGERLGAQATVAWTIRDRALQGVSCDVYVGGVNYYPNPCGQLPCNIPTGSDCPDLARRYCCVTHGATLSVGAQQLQFNDAHVALQTLADDGAIWRAFDVINGWEWDPSTNFVPPFVSDCVATDGCDQNFCFFGANTTNASPDGPMEYRSSLYTPTASSCKWASGFVCPNTSPNNYFWNAIP